MIKNDALTGIIHTDRVTFYLSDTRIKYHIGYQNWNLRVKHGNQLTNFVSNK